LISSGSVGYPSSVARRAIWSASSMRARRTVALMGCMAGSSENIAGSLLTRPGAPDNLRPVRIQHAPGQVGACRRSERSAGTRAAREHILPILCPDVAHQPAHPLAGYGGVARLRLHD